MIVYLPILVAVIGVLAYALSTNAKIVEIGRILFFSGSFVTLFQVAGQSISLMGK